MVRSGLDDLLITVQRVRYLGQQPLVEVLLCGRSEADVELITTYGTLTREGYLLRGRDADAEIRALKQRITKFERLKGWAVITGNGGTVVTLYPANRRKQRTMLAHRG